MNTIPFKHSHKASLLILCGSMIIPLPSLPLACKHVGSGPAMPEHSYLLYRCCHVVIQYLCCFAYKTWNNREQHTENDCSCTGFVAYFWVISAFQHFPFVCEEQTHWLCVMSSMHLYMCVHEQTTSSMLHVQHIALLLVEQARLLESNMHGHGLDCLVYVVLP